jgi:carboxylate-amine ligase
MARIAIDFVSSQPSTLGIEVELFLVDDQTHGLANAASTVLEAVGPVPLRNGQLKVKHEAYEHTVEIVTDVCTTVEEARADLAATYARLREAAEPLGLRLISSGTHPVSDWRQAEPTRQERYLSQVEQVQWIARRAQICSAHFHVGVDDGDKAIAIVNALMFYHPIFLALTASSPYYERDDTGMASCRTSVLEAMPTAGFPHLLADWAEFARMHDSLVASGTIDGIRDIWWDVRPHPEFGTVELRMCDSPSTLAEVGAVAALAQSLVRHLDDELEAGADVTTPPRWILRQNKWLAARYGLDAMIIVDEEGGRQSIRDMIPSLLEDLLPVARMLGCEDDLMRVARVLELGASYERQRRQVADGKTLEDVVSSLVTELETDAPAGPAPDGP